MQICRVVGTVVSTQKNHKLEGAKLMLVQPLTLEDDAARDDAAGDRLGRRRRRREGARRDRGQGGRPGARQEGRRRRRRDHRHHRRGGGRGDERRRAARARPRHASRACRRQREREPPVRDAPAAAPVHVASEPRISTRCRRRTARASSSRACRAITAATARRTDTDRLWALGFEALGKRSSHPADSFVGPDPAPVATHRRSLSRATAAIPRDELLRRVADKDALICVLTDRIDGERAGRGAGAARSSRTSPSATTTSTSPAARQRGRRRHQHAGRAHRSDRRAHLGADPRDRAARRPKGTG